MTTQLRKVLRRNAFEAQVASNPDHIALEAGQDKFTYAELNEKAESLARALAERGAAPGAKIGVCHKRNADLVVALLAVLKTGAAYLPLDPTYPVDRIYNSSDLAYQIYTSGSTGNPKGVMVTHRNAINFFAGMDGKIPLSEQSRLLAVTSMSFDISVLEIFWTLTRGSTLVLQTDGGDSGLPAFSLFYFASESAGSGHHAYRLLIEGAKFADENGFEAIWNPERHFHAFGGLYPNPAVSLAAVAGMTKNVKLRGGSCVLPLHHRKDVMVESIETMRALWRGEKRSFPGHDGKPVEVEIFPRPVNGELPMWVTAAGNPETFAIAAKGGFGVLTHRGRRHGYIDASQLCRRVR